MQGQQVLHQDAAAAALLRVATRVRALLRCTTAPRRAALALGAGASNQRSCTGCLHQRRQPRQLLAAACIAASSCSTPHKHGWSAAAGKCCEAPTRVDLWAWLGATGALTPSSCSASHLRVKCRVLVVGPAAAAAGGARHICHGAPGVHNDCKLLGGGPCRQPVDSGSAYALQRLPCCCLPS